MSFPTSPAGIEVRVCPDKEAAAEAALAELCVVLARPDRPLVSFATGATFTFMLTRLEQEVQAGRVSLDGAVATHLDEYEGFLPRQQGSMVHELCAACPSLIGMLDRGAFHPVPCVADPAHAAAHERKLGELGGVQLQFLGIGRNGHLAFHEPGVPFDRGYHIAELSESTRRDAVARFAPLPVPHRAVTAGVATILRGKRIVLCAFGKAKAPAVRAMLQGEPSVQCPASALRAHGSALILLDSDAASEL